MAESPGISHTSLTEQVAHAVLAGLLGQNPQDYRKRMLLRQFRDRLQKWAGSRGPAATLWRQITSAPMGRLDSLIQLIEECLADDVVAAHLAQKIGHIRREQPPHHVRYRDFTVSIEEGPNGPSTRLLESPCGRRDVVPLELSKSLQDPRALRWQIEHALRSHQAQRNARRRVTHVASKLDLEHIGRALFSALFVRGGGVREAWAECRGWLRGHPTLGLRLRLVFDLENPRPRLLSALPWELILDDVDNRPIAKEIRTPVVRGLETVRRGSGGSGRPLRRILLLRSQPRNQAILALDTENRRLADAWRGVPGVRVESAIADLQTLRDVLLAQRFEILHFMGHATFDPKAQQGALIFEGQDGHSFQVGASTLVDELSGLGVDLVVLNACRSGEIASAVDARPFSGVATALVQKGIPAVVAMQYPISDAGAIAFGQKLYQRLAAGDPLEAAVTEGRIALSRNERTTLEWPVPVLYQHRSNFGVP